ncbi:MAG: hypothetical protein ACXABY_04705 [Candidatus Thorarchaeota archaeon]|jgi:hypothetical protein
MNEWRMMTISEVIDKLCILKVKCEHYAPIDTDKYTMAKGQHDFISDGFWDEYAGKLPEEQKQQLLKLMFKLHASHRMQWVYEDRVLSEDDPKQGLQSAKEARKLNMNRASIKRDIDILLGEKYLELKDYAEVKDVK